ncbi:MAG: class I SAM-dependent methyltransferase [Actinobacteria bacterium]|nr:class I SAM-dependent methyltransferase [Actinomycetota bacterium]MCA1722158.1 class I SAM-dependent methyltransferase [Actinomycetota bacterium]
MIPDDERWNHNIHYHRVIHAALPHPCRSVLDVGCGEGVLTRQLRRRAVEVLGIDLDEQSIQLAREQSPTADIRYVVGDVLTHPFEDAPFGAVVSVATLHHLDAEAGLRRMAELVAPGGTLAVVGLARSRLPHDVHWELAAVVAHRAQRLLHRYWEHSAPMVWPPPLTYGQMQSLATALLPGARFRRHALWRYPIVWRKPLH